MYFYFVFRYVCYSEDDLLKEVKGCSFNKHLKKLGLSTTSCIANINPLNTKRRLLYLKTLFVPRSKHFSSRL